MTDVNVVLTTFPDIEKARQIGTVLVERQLVACVNLLGSGESIYQWEGKVCRENEVISLMKTTKGRLEELKAVYTELHPYEVPEFLVLGVEGGSPEYLAWLIDSVAE